MVESVCPSEFEVVTEADIYYCFRVLLRREPGPEDWKFWRPVVANRQVTLRSLVNSFLRSEEFQKTQRKMAQPRLVQLDDFRIYVRIDDVSIGAAIEREKQYEPHVARELLRCVRPGSVFVDVGANIGYLSCVAAVAAGPTGRVLAFEPNPHNCRLLEATAKENGFGHVEIHQFAVADAKTRLQLTVDAADSNGMLRELDSDALVTGHIVDTVVLDDYLGEIERIDVVKMDIEGAEGRAIRGMQNLLRKHQPVLLTEFSPSLLEKISGISAGQFLQLLASLGYQIRVLETRVGSKRRTSTTDDILRKMDAALRAGMTHLDLAAYPA